MMPSSFPDTRFTSAAYASSNVNGFAAGDEVNVIPSFSMNDYATYGEVILVPDYAVVRQPKALSFTEAASVWTMFVTAYGALTEDAEVAKGDFVLIPAASSSVGLAAIQIANYAGATTIALTRTSAKKRQLLDAGAAHVIATAETAPTKRDRHLQLIAKRGRMSPQRASCALREADIDLPQARDR
jgi:NADPH:quinone reductase-like Zn-dependent oxidoreductase